MEWIHNDFTLALRKHGINGGIVTRTVIIPTLNEAQNIKPLIQSIFKYLGTEEVHIIIVDDNSTDGTHAIIEQLMQEYEQLSMIIRVHERGLGSAVREGVRYVQSGQIVVMDADFSHHPRFLPKMFEKLDSGYDIVVGSRYSKGGAIAGWTGMRIAMSLIATRLTAILFQVKTTDPMSGLVGCKSPQLLATGFKGSGFKFLLELLVRNPTLRVADIPIVFQDRVRGSSKLGSGTIIQFLSLIARLVFTRKSKEIYKQQEVS